MNRKKKGQIYEIQLAKILIDKGYGVLRCAGSGTMNNADCDLYAGKRGKHFCIEVKSTSKERIHIEREQFERFIKFSKKTGLTPIFAIKFIKRGWRYFKPQELNEFEKGFSKNFHTVERSEK